MRSVVIIPARAASTRFPNKPLKKIAGKEMILHVVENAKGSIVNNSVIVATESELIQPFCSKNNINCQLTSDKHPTGTDRVAEVAEVVDADIYIVLMGDEPFITSQQINQLIEEMQKDKSIFASMLCTIFTKPVDVINPTTIKLALNDKNELIFISRSAVPFPKGDINFNYYKNMGCYAFRKEALDFFKKKSPDRIERAEEIEMLRFLEAHKLVKCVPVDSDSFSIDTQNDLDKANEYFLKNEI